MDKLAIIPITKKELAAKKASKRLNICWGVIGTNRTGKSVTIVAYAEAWRDQRPAYHKIIALDPQKRFAHLLDEELLPSEKDCFLDKERYRNSLLILDDYKMLNDGDRALPGLADLMYLRSEYNCDIIYITHNPSLIINIFTYFTTHYFLFYSESMDGSFKKKIMNYPLCVRGQRLISDYVNANGRGACPLFPHVIVDTENRELIAVNMNKQISQKNEE